MHAYFSAPLYIQSDLEVEIESILPVLYTSQAFRLKSTSMRTNQHRKSVHTVAILTYRNFNRNYWDFNLHGDQFRGPGIFLSMESVISPPDFSPCWIFLLRPQGTKNLISDLKIFKN